MNEFFTARTRFKLATSADFYHIRRSLKFAAAERE